MKRYLSSIVILGLLAAPASYALDDDFKQKIVVDAGRQEVSLKENRVTFYDDVQVTQGSIKMNADQLSVIGSEEAGSEVMIAQGQPATFYQMMENGKPIEAEAHEIRYELATRTLTLTKEAELKQEESLVRGEMIRYSIDLQEMVAQGGENSRVTTIFLPQQLEELEQYQQQGNQE
ncbi:lipopolysaccharide transport periplasmic protein LptA [Aliagarivorans marinus]|uniref:lipopolysaccharide transport periplasmic protein LptA n=1 Tax=Aliagarivorans marinus TaxID=561965 RepID=UPI00047EF338|nr:lipopolysaccharide transport periplasmic protein LptA [Aliagarivorans marinus]